MSSTDMQPAGEPLGNVKFSWGWMLALGILMAVLGVIGLGMAYYLTIAAILWFGVLAIIAGIVQLVDAFHYKGWKSILWHVIIAAVYVIAGIVLIAMPVASAFWLTIFLAASLVVTGIARVIMSFQIRKAGAAWIWVLISGLISIVLGILVYGTVIPPSGESLATAEGQTAWVRDWGWVIGLFVAIELIVQGVTLISIALTGRAMSGGSSGTATPTAA